MLRVPADRRLDPADRRGDVPEDKRLVGLLDAARLELSHDRCLRRVMASDHQQAAGVPVEAMHDPGPLDAGDAAPRRAVAVRQQRIDQGPAAVPGRRMDDQAGRLVEDQQVIVLVHDPKWDLGRRREVERDRLRDVETQLRSGTDDRVRLQGFAAGRQPAVGDELLDEAARQARRVGDVPVDPAARPVRHVEHAHTGRGRVNHPTVSHASRQARGRPPRR